MQNFYVSRGKRNLTFLFKIISIFRYQAGTPVPKDDQKIVGRYFGVNFTTLDTISEGLNMKYRMDLGGDPGNTYCLLLFFL